MSRRFLAASLRLAALLAVVLVQAGCADKGARLGPDALQSSSLVSDVRTAAAEEAMGLRGIYRRIWPHEDGRSWTYRAVERNWDDPDASTTYPTADQVPRLTLDDAAALLGAHPIGSNPRTWLWTYGLRFNGSITTLSGVTAQNLEETITDPTARIALASTLGRGKGFMKLLLRARPDLATKLGVVTYGADARTDSVPVVLSTLLHGYAWEQNENWIGTYGDLNQQVAWIYLTSNLAPGSEFSLQLIPDLASDVFLHARVLGREEVATDAGTYHQAIQVLYLVDFGISAATDENGNPIGYTGAYLYGTVAYAPGVGPVHSYERFIPSIGSSVGPGAADLELTLVATEPGPRAHVPAP